METNVTFEMMYAAIVANTEAVKANTEALLQAKAEQPAAEQPTTKRGRKAKAETEQPAAEQDGVTLTDCETALLEVKAKHGCEAAKAIVERVCGVATIKKADSSTYADVVAACEAKMKEEVAEQDEEAEQATPEVDITLADLKAKAGELAKLLGSSEKSKELIAKYGAKKTDDLEIKFYGALMTDFEVEIAKAQADDDL
nr:MAG TPA: hypothetical protein [Caudoviricetes sp.]